MTVNKSDSIYDARLIREEAEARGYRPVDIASGAGISVETAYGVLRGDNVRVSTLKAVCEMLGLEVRVAARFRRDTARVGSAVADTGERRR